VCPAGGITADAIALRQNLINKEQGRAASSRNPKRIEQWQAEIESLERVRKKLLEGSDGLSG
jgi:hypothetical protein